MILDTLYDDGTWKICLEEATLPDGRTKKASRVHRCPSVHVIASTDAGNILLLREFRPFYGTWVWMLPSGRVDKETDIEAASRRELREETGFDAEVIQKLWEFCDSESVCLRHYVFAATKLSPAPLPQDADELIEVHTCTVDEALDRVLQSPQVHTLSAAALLRWKKEKR